MVIFPFPVPSELCHSHSPFLWNVNQINDSACQSLAQSHAVEGKAPWCGCVLPCVKEKAPCPPAPFWVGKRSTAEMEFV